MNKFNGVCEEGNLRDQLKSKWEFSGALFFFILAVVATYTTSVAVQNPSVVGKKKHHWLQSKPRNGKPTLSIICPSSTSNHQSPIVPLNWWVSPSILHEELTDYHEFDLHPKYTIKQIWKNSTKNQIWKIFDLLIRPTMVNGKDFFHKICLELRSLHPSHVLSLSSNTMDI